jgi:hypothetical protein
MNYGSLKTLVELLGAFLVPLGISVVFGEENIRAQDAQLPMVVVVPIGGQWVVGGASYYKSANPNVGGPWMTQENIDLYLWSADIDSDGRAKDNATAIDHANAVENLRARVLQAFQSQTAFYATDGVTKKYGFMFRPTSGRWERQGDEINRYGRVYVLTVNVDITVPDVLPVDATIDEVILDPITMES